MIDGDGRFLTVAARFPGRGTDGRGTVSRSRHGFPVALVRFLTVAARMVAARFPFALVRFLTVAARFPFALVRFLTVAARFPGRGTDGRGTTASAIWSIKRSNRSSSVDMDQPPSHPQSRYNYITQVAT